MAMTDAVTCPDCPPAHTPDHAMTMPDDPAGHGGAVDHDAGSAGESCTGELLDCVNLEDINQTGRQEQSTSEPGLVWIVPAPERSQHIWDERTSRLFCRGDPVRLAGAFPPLNILYCIYLD